eukprot:6213896-Pleurochrysis_carterae.AAC.3
MHSKERNLMICTRSRTESRHPLSLEEREEMPMSDILFNAAEDFNSRGVKINAEMLSIELPSQWVGKGHGPAHFGIADEQSQRIGSLARCNLHARSGLACSIVDAACAHQIPVRPSDTDSCLRATTPANFGCGLQPQK